jgi:glycosyltransferase involved in cell wall biosynthesis
MKTNDDLEPTGVTVVVPAYNEEDAIGETLQQLKAMLSGWSRPSEIIVVDDGSSDKTASVASGMEIQVISHPLNSGYGRSLISGIEAARYDTIAIVDADGTYPVEKLPELLTLFDKGFHMVVAARQGQHYDGALGKRFLRMVFRTLAEYTCGRKIPDINSGFRVFDRRPVLAWRASLSTGFSFTTTITLLFMLNHLFVGYMPMTYSQRVGQSKVRLFRDSLRSLQIILTTIAQFNPLKFFLLLLGANLAGNIVIWGLQASQIAMVGWNMGCLISALAILALIFIKPAASKVL